jgi:hypothetical protein
VKLGLPMFLTNVQEIKGHMVCRSVGPSNWNIDSSDRRSVRASKEHRNEGKKSNKCKETGEGKGERWMRLKYS